MCGNSEIVVLQFFRQEPDLVCIRQIQIYYPCYSGDDHQARRKLTDNHGNTERYMTQNCQGSADSGLWTFCERKATNNFLLLHALRIMHNKQQRSLIPVTWPEAFTDMPYSDYRLTFRQWVQHPASPKVRKLECFRSVQLGIDV